MELAKLFGDSRKVCYKDSYKKIVGYLSPYIKDKRCYAEIAAVLFVVVDLAVYHNKKNRQAVADIIYPLASDLTGQSIDFLFKRVDFYSKFIRGKQPRMDFCFETGEVDNMLLRIIMALGDVVYNPELIDDYDQSPVIVTNIFENMKYTEIIKKNVMKEIAFLYEFEGERSW